MPLVATPAGLVGLFAIIILFYLIMMARFSISPGVIEVCIGAVFGVLSGLLTAHGWRGRIGRAAVRNRNRAVRPILLPLEGYDPGPDVILWLAGLPIAIGALASHYAVWRAMPSLSMPWARFAELLSFSQTDAGGLGFPLESLAAMVVVFGLITYLVMTISMLSWYRDLPNSSPARDL